MYDRKVRTNREKIVLLQDTKQETWKNVPC